MFDRLALQPPDPLLNLIVLHDADLRANKIDLGVGVYRDDNGVTPVFASVKQAEARLLSEQTTKAYLGPGGDTVFATLISDLALGADRPSRGREAALQTPGGTGALRLGMQLAGLAAPGARLLVGRPGWANHEPIPAAVGIEVVAYPHTTPDRTALDFGAMCDALEQARAGDVVLLHASCHNPTGIDLDQTQWASVATMIARRGLVPFIDVAYQGLGQGLDADMAGARLLLGQVGRAFISVSCSKNFGLYRDRVGALIVQTATAAEAEVVRSHVARIARTLYSMPPDHGAAVVRIILSDPVLRTAWEEEVAVMRARIRSLRALLAQYGRVGPIDFAALGAQRGMFAMLPITPENARRLRGENAIYLADSGRINIVGLVPDKIDQLVGALRQGFRTDKQAIPSPQAHGPEL